jgi:hypothetical protein
VVRLSRMTHPTRESKDRVVDVLSTTDRLTEVCHNRFTILGLIDTS